MATQTPNILMIFGDDIGILQVEHLYTRHHGLPHAQHRPRRQRRARCSPMATDEQSCTAGRAVLHPRAVADPHRT